MGADDSTQGLKRKERERLAHRQEILAAAERVFARNGYRGATVEQIAQEAEFAVGTLYNYFPKGKEELYEEVLAGLIEASLATFRDTVLSQADPVAAVEALIEFRVRILDEHKGFARVVFQTPLAEQSDASLALPQRCLALIQDAKAAFTRVLERGIVAGVFVDVGAANLELCLQGILNAFIARWLIHETQEPVAQRVAALRAIVLRLLLARGTDGERP
ncbi:MAG TPA: helix-turn-helix domain-containing protein [Planctomycetota bacterium]|nr:helix-turn-helix domain-containing protein [Planctomycetota bacterium]HRR83132.1 helix-turn-helix domain-containing protein [Planctomycetota bacterium]HRT97775.1 helix-turn-helix domain-containing protein [Planctomycetota bacterium]